MQNNYVNIVVKNKYTFIIITFLSLILLVEFTLNNALVTEYNQDPKITNHYLNDFSMTETNKSGALNWSLKGDRLEKYPKSERSEVFSPNMRIYSIDSSFWDIKAEHALDPDSLFESIYLTGEVVFTKMDIDNNNEVIIETSSAIIYPNREVVETEKYAKITTPNSVTTGDGVIANIKKGSVEILSNAKRISFTDEKSEQISGERMIYNLSKKTWTVSRKVSNDKKNIVNRVKTILRTKK
tara:strand:+ start:49921 stop:50640 length:720 start_codon:yes stop_codon:yes gene_type:complete